MKPRPVIALLLYQLILAVLQLAAYNAHGWLALVTVWTIITVASLIDTRSARYRISQVVIQTACFIVLLAGVDPGQITLSFFRLGGK
jgi:hypothetical protein